MRDIKGVIFDMDGVIFDTERIYLDTWTKVFKNHGYDMTKDIYISVMGIGRQNVINKFINHYGNDLPIMQMYKEKDEELYKFLDENELPIKSGVYELLEYLKENEYKVALATSAKRERAISHLKEAKIEERFNVIVCGDDISNYKPNPEIFLRASDKLGLKPSECIVVEDSPAGLKAAYNAKIRAIHIPDLKVADDEMKKHTHKSFESLLNVINYLKDEQ